VPVNYYVGKDEAELLVLLDAVQKRASIGSVFFVTSSGIQTQRSFQGSGPVDREIRRLLYALHLLSPGTYSDPYAVRIRRTRVRYTRS